jgi:nicotinate-nucleotide pyrophosphorylase (carboxylating)
MALIKDNHLRAAGGIAEAVRRVRARAGPSVRVEVEVETLREVEEAVAAGADVIMLDNMAPADMVEAVRRVGGRALVEASGGIRLEDLPIVAAAGVDYISLGYLTTKAAAVDLSLELRPAGVSRGQGCS